MEGRGGMGSRQNNSVDPIHAARQATRRIVILGVACAACTLAWAFLPSRRSEWNQPVVLAPAAGSDATLGESAQTPPVDAAAYRVALWVPPPPPPAAPAKPQPIALNLQLLGIHHERSGDHDILRATLYDPATDRIHIVADGDKLGAFTIASVNTKGVDVSDGTLVRTLALDSGGKALPARAGKGGTR